MSRSNDSSKPETLEPIACTLSKLDRTAYSRIIGGGVGDVIGSGFVTWAAGAGGPRADMELALGRLRLAAMVVCNPEKQSELVELLPDKMREKWTAKYARSNTASGATRKTAASLRGQFPRYFASPNTVALLGNTLCSLVGDGITDVHKWLEAMRARSALPASAADLANNATIAAATSATKLTQQLALEAVRDPSNSLPTTHSELVQLALLRAAQLRHAIGDSDLARGRCPAQPPHDDPAYGAAWRNRITLLVGGVYQRHGYLDPAKANASPVSIRDA